MGASQAAVAPTTLIPAKILTLFFMTDFFEVKPETKSLAYEKQDILLSARPGERIKQSIAG